MILPRPQGLHILKSGPVSFAIQTVTLDGRCPSRARRHPVVRLAALYISFAAARPPPTRRTARCHVLRTIISGILLAPRRQQPAGHCRSHGRVDANAPRPSCTPASLIHTEPRLIATVLSLEKHPLIPCTFLYPQTLAVPRWGRGARAPKLGLGPKFSRTVDTLWSNDSQNKNSKFDATDATRCQLLRLKCTKFDFRSGAPPQTPLGSLQRSPRNITSLTRSPENSRKALY